MADILSIISSFTLFIKETGVLGSSFLALFLSYKVYKLNESKLGIVLIILNEKKAEELRRLNENNELRKSESGFYLFIEISNASRVPIRIKAFMNEEDVVILLFSDNPQALNGFMLKEAGASYKNVLVLSNKTVSVIENSKELIILDFEEKKHKLSKKELGKIKEDLKVKEKVAA